MTSMIKNVGAKMIDTGTLGVLNVASIDAPGPVVREESHEDSDELLCF